jgi:hypothetical protein
MARDVERDTLLDAIDGAGLPEEAAHWNYSGRFMYGDTCFGLVVQNDGDFAMFCAVLGSSADDWDWVHGVRSDNFGRGMIYYWPEVKVVDEA